MTFEEFAEGCPHRKEALAREGGKIVKWEGYVCEIHPKNIFCHPLIAKDKCGLWYTMECIRKILTGKPDRY